MAVAAWICSLLGLGLTYIVLLGNAMSTVPQKLTPGPALLLCVLPVIALVVIGFGLQKSFATNDSTKGFFTLILPLLINLFSFWGILSSYNPLWLQWISNGPAPPAKSINLPDGKKPFYELEIRLAHDEPGPGRTEVLGNRLDHPVFVEEEVLLTNKDVENTFTKGPYPIGGYLIGITFVEGSRARVEELSRQHLGKRWAIFLNGDLLVAPGIAEAFRDEVVAGGGFNRTAAGNYSRGIVRSF